MARGSNFYIDIRTYIYMGSYTKIEQSAQIILI